MRRSVDRPAVEHAQGKKDVSQCRACKVPAQQQSTRRGEAKVVSSGEKQLLARMHELVWKHPRYRDRMIGAQLEQEGRRLDSDAVPAVVRKHYAQCDKARGTWGERQRQRSVRNIVVRENERIMAIVLNLAIRQRLLEILDAFVGDVGKPEA